MKNLFTETIIFQKNQKNKLQLDDRNSIFKLAN
jgi:hypothetical protein